MELNNTVPGQTAEETVALAGQTGYRPDSDITADNVTINGIRLPYALGKGKAGGALLFANLPGRPVNGYSLHASPPPYPFPTQTLGGQSVEIRFPIVADPLPGAINGQARLTAGEVTAIIDRASDRARTTRAGIRLPIGSAAQVWITVVGNPNLDGTPAPISSHRAHAGGHLLLVRRGVAKSADRPVFFHQSNGAEHAHRGLSGAERVPARVDRQGAGPAGTGGVQAGRQHPDGRGTASAEIAAAAAPCCRPACRRMPRCLPRRRRTPICRTESRFFRADSRFTATGQLIGAVGVSGDGVDQDDLVGRVGVRAPCWLRRMPSARISLLTMARACPTPSFPGTRGFE